MVYDGQNNNNKRRGWGGVKEEEKQRAYTIQKHDNQTIASEKVRSDCNSFEKHTQPKSQTLLIILGKRSLVRQLRFYPQYIFKLYAVKQKYTIS